MRETLIRAAASRTFYFALLAVAVLVNAAGYLLELWHDETLFDEAVHFYTSFAAVACIGRFALGKRPWHGRLTRWWALLIAGLLLGIAWEAFEWAIGIIGNRRDTIVDLLMDTAGTASAAWLVRWVEKEGGPWPPARPAPISAKA